MRSTTLAVLIAALVAVAGCTGGTVPGTDPGTTTDGPTTVDPEYDAYVFDHAGLDGAAIEGGIAHPEEFGATNGSQFYASLVTSEAAADRFNDSVLDAEARSYVNETDFDEAYLLVVQAYPASSVPDYRVTGVVRDGDHLGVRINDSSNVGTGDITVETVLIRIQRDGRAPPSSATVTTEEGFSFGADSGVVTRRYTTNDSDDEDDVTLPIEADDPAKNLDDAVVIRIVNRGDDLNGYSVSLTVRITPECREETPPCGQPTREETVGVARGKLRPNGTRTVENVIARRGTYTVTVTAEVPGEDGSRRTIERTVSWSVEDPDDDLVVVITDDGVEVRNGSA